MKNNKGFSILELIVSFSLTMIIVIILFEIIISMKNLYEKSVTKSEMINNQNLFIDYIYSDINSKSLNRIDICGNNCIVFNYEDSAKTLEWSYEGNENNQMLTHLKYGDYAVNMINGTRFDLSKVLVQNDNKLEGVTICNGYSTDDEYVSIKLPIYHKMFKDENFGLNIVHYFQAADIINNLPDNCE